MKKNSGGIIERYLHILEVIAASHDSLSLTEIKELTGLPKATAHRLINSLVDAGAVTTNGSWHKTFRIGSRMWRLLYLGQNADSIMGYSQIVVDDLARELGETCYVVRLGHQKVRCITRSIPSQGYRLHVIPGSELPCHAAASAKSIIAFQEEEVIKQILVEPLESMTDRTKTSINDVLAELESVRQLDYSICEGEIDVNVMAYAAPVHLEKAGVIYSVGVTGPDSRLKEQPKEHWVKPLQEAANRLSCMLAALGVSETGNLPEI